MRLRPSNLLLPLLLCACSAETANSNGANGATSAPNGAPAPQQQGKSAEAPKPSAGVALSVAPQTASEGDTLTLTLTNGSQEQLGYNLCATALETGAGRPVPTSKICTMELRALEPGRTATYRYELPETMVTGSYRLVTQVEWMGSGRRGGIRSNGFEVR